MGGNIGQVFTVTQDGEIKVRLPLDRETTESYMLWIEARDSGTPSLSSVLSQRIELLDENDHVPRFDNAFYNVTVPEEEWAPIKVTQVNRKLYLILNRNKRKN